MPSDAIVVVSATRAIERVVPLTRLPLRHHAERITWQDDVPGAGNGATRSERHATLAAFELNPDPARATVLAAAYREEDAEGRLLALGALAALPSMPTVRAVFCEALRVGTDEERARAVDAIEASGERDDLVTAFADRVDAIAAKAALAYVGTHRRDDYRRALEPYVDPRRIERLLALLAGFVE